MTWKLPDHLEPFEGYVECYGWDTLLQEKKLKASECSGFDWKNGRIQAQFDLLQRTTGY